MPVLKLTILLLNLTFLVYPALSSANEGHAGEASISLSVDHGDGGRQSDRQMRYLLAALNDMDCHVTKIQDQDQALAQLRFDPTPVSESKLKNLGYRLIARAITLQGESTIRGAVLVHASTDIRDLASLQGQRISFVSKRSPSGYLEPVKLLQEAGVNESWDTFFFAGSHVGSISNLLHSDTDVAVAAEPLARRWAEYNNLSVVALSDEVETGGWWADSSISDMLISNCKRALESLDRSDMKALPAWIGGFKGGE